MLPVSLSPHALFQATQIGSSPSLSEDSLRDDAVFEEGLETWRQADTGHENAAFRIKENRCCHWHIIDLSRKGLKNLPAIFQKLHHLQSVNLSENALFDVPSALASLPALLSLDLSNNQITTFSWPSEKISPLCHLDVSRNQIATVAKTIQNLPQLVILILNDNQLETLPEEISSLGQLEQLHLSHNLFKELPPPITKLSVLATLDLSHNHIKVLGAEIGDLAQLQFLNLRSNQLTNTPVAFVRLRKLTTVFLNENRLQAIPGLSFLVGGCISSSQSALRVINLAGNRFSRKLSLEDCFLALLSPTACQQIQCSRVYNVPCTFVPISLDSPPPELKIDLGGQRTPTNASGMS